jgi:murein DD-endopeptidase MepM/ murein hydrolase activator NlpD/uncharacterized protein YraI
MTTPAPVPKPSNAGTGQVSIITTANVFANIRNGPGTQYRDIGDLYNNTLVVYFPNTLRPDGWVWVEQRELGGWVSTSVARFEQAVGTIPSNQPATPYDGMVAVWFWKGTGLSERSLEQFVRNLKQRAPNVRQVWVKTSDGSDFMGRFDPSGGDMAITGPEAIERWVRVLQQNGLEFHAWCVPTGLNIDAEANIIATTCRVPGVRSMVLDIEPYAGFWQGGREAVRPFMLQLRQRLGGRYHIGMSVDPRPQHYSSVFPDEWRPFVNSLHPQCYWVTFRSDPESVLRSAWETLRSFGKPIVPVLQGDGALVDQQVAHTVATQRLGAPGVSWWRYGVIAQFEAVNRTITVVPPNRPITNPSDNIVDEIVIIPRGRGFRFGTYTGRNELNEYQGTWGWPVLYKQTEVATSKVWAEWRAELPADGVYEISVFVPARHSTTTRARYKVHGIRGTTTETVIDINQSITRNVWVTLGVFELDRRVPNAGKVALNDVTGEPDKEIAFDAVRFRRIVRVQNPTTNPGTPGNRPSIVDGVPVADGYDSPTGTEAQRRGAQVWPAGWSDASPFGRRYFVGTPSEAYHTGADLNFGAPREDLGMPVYSTANGVVTFAARLPVWGNVIIVRHDPLYVPTGRVTYARYGHVQNMRVKVGDRVRRGQQICEIGDGFGRFVPHLHFDISPTTILEIQPQHWPGLNQRELLANYVDPLQFIRQNRP